MKNYAIVPELSPYKLKWLLQPWVHRGAVSFQSIDQVPKDFIILSVMNPPWLSPLKNWVDTGGKFIEIEWGYWGERPLENKKSRIQVFRVSYCHSHNIHMKPVPFSRINTLTPTPADWKKQRGNILTLIEPSPEWVEKRTGVQFDQWRQNLENKVREHWDGLIYWREKRSGASTHRFYTFIQDVNNSFAVVGERTMACVEAVMLGCPAYTIDISAVTPLMGNDLSALRNPVLPDRTKWFEHIAWSQFHATEFYQGSEVAEMVEKYQID